MERQRVCSTRRLNHAGAWPRLRKIVSGGALVSLWLAIACASPLDKARSAWADGEGDFTEAEPLFQEAIAKENSDSEFATEELFEIHMQLALANKKEHPKQGEEHFRAALALDAESAEARTGLIRLLMNLYRYEEAFALANEGATTGKCPGCKRLLAVMLIESGDQRTELEDWPSAEAAYNAAMDLLPDASVALGLVRARVAQTKVELAADALRTAADMIDQNDLEGRRRFLELRRALVLAALADDKAMLADEVLDVAPKGVAAAEQLGLVVEVSMELTKAGKADEALARMQALAQAAESGKLRVNDEQRAELLIRVALLFGARANQRLAEGDVPGASADLEEALKLVPGEPTIIMQKAVVFGSEGQIAAARDELGKLSPKTPGFRTVDSLLYAMEVDELMADGKLGEAIELVDFGKRADPSVPEIHVAAAQVLMATPFEDMLKKEQSNLRRRGLVKYPRGKHRPTKAGEALSELAWARKAKAAQDKLFPFQDPGLEDRLAQTEASIKAFYTLPVEFISDPKTIIVLKNTGTAKQEVVVQRGRFFRKKKKIAPGETAEVEMTKGGVVTFTYGGDEEKEAMFIAEPHTKVEISLP